jgi:prophage antirepressor-like protein
LWNYVSDNDKKSGWNEEIEVKNVNVNNTTQIKNIFKYKNNNIVIILDKNGKTWYKGKDIANILEFVNTKDALIRLVDKKYKQSYAELESEIPTP